MNKTQLQALKTYFNYGRGLNNELRYNKYLMIDNKQVITNGYSMVVFNDITITNEYKEETKNYKTSVEGILRGFNSGYDITDIDITTMEIIDKKYLKYNDKWAFQISYINNIKRILGNVKYNYSILNDNKDYSIFMRIENTKNNNVAYLLCCRIF
jgi:hypothetical protein